MNDGAYGHRDEDDRRAWRQAAKRGRRQLVELHEQWVLPPESWYRDNSRATLRDETWPEWRQRATCRVPTDSSVGRWALAESYADLFDPTLQGDALVQAVEAWHRSYLGPPPGPGAWTLPRRWRCCPPQHRPHCRSGSWPRWQRC